MNNKYFMKETQIEQFDSEIQDADKYKNKKEKLNLLSPQ